jgi:hypothetical protein
MNTLIRKYTPPTCTLEIWGNLSPLTVWSQKDRLAEARFALHLDDPRMSEDEQITIRGDRSQLQELRGIVNRYVQNLLGGNRATTSPALPAAPYLQPIDRLNHELFLGSLDREGDRPSIALTTSQLFDLADSLEEYGSETEILPRLLRQQGRKSALIGLGAIASVLLLAVGGTLFSLRMYRDGNAIAPETPPPSPRTGGNLPPLPLPPTGRSAPSPTVPSALGNKPPLPPPSVVAPVAPPTRAGTVPPVVPPRPYLPSPPPGNLPTTGGTIVIQPQGLGSPISAPPAPTGDRPNAQASVSPEAMNPSPIAPKLPPLPPLTRSIAPSPSPTPVPSTNLLDTIPQVAQVREYFQSRWQPPASLNQTLEYRLVLNGDGSLKQIIPLGQAANIYLDRTGMPLLNEPFVSPPDIGGNPQVRLVLSPDGTVRTFLE